MPVYFRIRAADRTGTDLLPATRYRAGTDGDHFYVGAVAIGRLANRFKPSVQSVKQLIFGTRWQDLNKVNKIDVYPSMSATSPLATGNLDVTSLGTTKDDPILFVDLNDDEVVDSQKIDEYAAPIV